MVTTLAQVNVTSIDNGYQATCSKCDWSTKRRARIDADLAATGHVRTHGRPHPEDEEAVRG